MPISSVELRHFVGRPFVECGSAEGHGINSALIAGFNEVYSADINPTCYEHCSNLFKDDPRVHLFFGDCGTWLDKILTSINQACVIYLDANGWKDEKESPFHASINALLRHKSKEHILLVDDMNHGFASRYEVVNDLRASKLGDNKQGVINQVLLVNSNYNCYIIDTHTEDLSITYPSWVLVAEPVKTRIDVEYI